MSHDHVHVHRGTGASERRLLIALGILFAFTLVEAGGGWYVNSIALLAGAAHMLEDSASLFLAVVASLVIIGFDWVDPILSLLVSLLILRSGWKLTRESGRVSSLQSTPPTLDLPGVETALSDLPGAAGIHHLHAWSLTGEAPALTLRAQIAPNADQSSVLHAIHLRLLQELGVRHTTVQVECPDCAPASGGGGCHLPCDAA